MTKTKPSRTKTQAGEGGALMKSLKEDLAEQPQKPAIKLRARSPFWCRHISPDGKHDCLDAPLTDDEGDLCAAHQARNDSAHEKFFNEPVQAAKPDSFDELRARIKARGPIWPL